ncbi:MAG: response regulator [Verrucomicrobiota bacterium]
MKFEKTNRIRVLILEDRREDAELLEFELGRAGFDAEVRLARTQDEYAAQLNPALDLILSDYQLPQFDGLKALRMLREHGLDVPLIIVTGVLGDEMAAECIRQGAADYLLKDRLARLGKAAARAIEERRLAEERKRAEETLAATQQRLHHLLAHSPAVIYTLKVEGQTVIPELVSDNISALLGFATEETLAPNWWFEHVHPEDREHAMAGTKEIFTGRAASREYRIRHRDGTYRWVEDNQRLVNGVSDQPAQIVGVWTDITGRKRAELRTAAFSSLGQKLSSARTVREAAEIIVDVADQLFGWDACALDLLSPEGDRVQRVLNKDLIDGRRVDCPIPTEYQEPSARTRRTLKLGANLILREPPYALSPDSIPFGDISRPSASIMDVPVRDGTKIIGDLSVQSYAHKAYTAQDLGTLQALADHCGAALTRIQAQEALHESERLLRLVIDLVPHHVFAKDAKGRHLFANRACADANGLTPEQMVGRTNLDLVADRPEAEAFMRDDQEVISTGQPKVIPEERVTDCHGRIRAFRTIKVPFTAPGSGEPAVLGIAEDITERKQTEEALRAANERYSRQEEALGALTRSYALHAGDFSAVLREVTEVTARTLGVERASVWRYAQNERAIVCAELYEQSARRHSAGIVLKEASFPSYFQAMASSDIIAAHDAHRDPRTAEFTESYLRPLGIASMLDAPIHSKGATAGVLCCEHVGPPRQWTPDEQTFAIAVANLVSLLLAQEERQKLEEQFRQSQKMEAIGQLAGGVAHDFNNILTVIHGYADMLLEGGQLAAECRDPVEQMGQATERAASLTRQLLAFSRKQVLQPRPLDLNEVVAGVTQMLRRVIGEDISVRLEYAPHPLPIHADPGMLEQVLLNLAVNARDAMPRGGELVVTTTRLTVDEAHTRRMAAARIGTFVCLSARDTGCGMTPEIQARIFEPFFTTKPVGKGTGLGLATVQGIVQQHQGWIEVESAVGQGTEFKVFLPATSQTSPVPAKSTATMPIRGGHETVLLVEDEPALRQLARLVLERFGYRVFEATSGVDALSVWENRAAEIDLLLTDMVMPDGLTGHDLANRLKARKPTLKVVFTSGYSPEAASGELGLEEAVNFLPKPYTPQKLARLLRDVLDRSA